MSEIDYKKKMNLSYQVHFLCFLKGKTDEKLESSIDIKDNKRSHNSHCVADIIQMKLIIVK